MSLNNMQVFNDFLYTAVTETVDQQIALFNEASRNAIQMRSIGRVGDFYDEVFYKAFATPARRRDPYSTGAVAAQALAQDAMTKVKVGGANGPFSFDPAQFNWIQKNPEEAAVVISDQVSKAIMQDMLNAGLLSAVAAIGNQASLVNDISATASTEIGALNNTAAKFGDRATEIAAWVMHSKAYFDTTASAITNTNRLYEFGTINVVTDGFGRPLVVTDAPALTAAGPIYNTLGLVSGGVVIEDNGDFFANTETTNGDENITRTWQAEYSFNVGIKGYQWDKVNGGKAPSDADLGTGSNWDKVASFNKDTAGVLLISQ